MKQKSQKQKIYEGKAKILYRGHDNKTLIQYFKDDATAYNNQKYDVFLGKGILNNRISEYLFTGLHEIGIPNHFIQSLNMREQLIHKVDIIPIEVIVRNVAAGSMSKRLGIESGTRLPRSIVEYCYKNDALNDPLISEEHITAMGWASHQDLDDMMAMALRINDYISGIFYAIGIRLIDFKLEFGHIEDDNGEMRVILADEISPDTCRLWDIKTGEKLDKDNFREDIGNLLDAYQEIANRLALTNQDKDS